MLAAFAALFVALHLTAIRAEIFRRRVRRSELAAAEPRAAALRLQEGTHGIGG
jgi:hypothetical protein